MKPAFAALAALTLAAAPQLAGRSEAHPHPTAGAGGYLGVGLEDPSEAACIALGHGPACGALVADVQPDGPAAKADLRRGDLITRIDGKPIDSAAAVTFEIAARKPNKRITIGIRRRGKQLHLTATLGKRPAGGGWPGHWSWQGKHGKGLSPNLDRLLERFAPGKDLEQRLRQLERELKRMQRELKRLQRKS